jgi:hypothetical protein
MSGYAPGIVLDTTTRFPTDPNGPENPVHALDVFSRGLPLDPRYFSGFRKRQTEVEMTEGAMRQVMLGLDIRPHSLVMNPRAHIFPEKIEAVIFHAKSTIFDTLLAQMAEYEAFNRRRLGHAFANGEVHDVQKVGKNDSFIPYGFWRGNSQFLGGEVWQVKRRDKRADALVWFLDQRKKKALENGEELLKEEFRTLSPGEQMNHYRFSSDFGTIDIDDYPVEEQDEIINKMKLSQNFFPFLRTNYYRINYYCAPGGDFFFGDVLPDERSDYRQWMEYLWMKGAQWGKILFGRKQTTPQQPNQTQAFDMESGKAHQKDH